MACGFLIVLAIIVFLGCLSAISTEREEGMSIAIKEKENVLGAVIGIDLGTTYPRVGVYKPRNIHIIANDQVNITTPSIWEKLIGEAAKNQTAAYPEKSIFFYARRLIGRKFEDKEVQRDINLGPYRIVNKDGKPYIQVKIGDGMTKVFSPEEITALFLNKMKKTAEAFLYKKNKTAKAFLHKKVKNAVVTVPAHFNDAQRQAIKDAGIMAGLKVASVVSEPTAAVFASTLYTQGGWKKVLVFDLGGGTFDVSILTVDNGVVKVIATSGDSHLGGDDFDQRVMEYFIKLIKRKHGKDLSKDKNALVKLRRECERAKRALSSQSQVQVEIESLFDGVSFSEPLTRPQFEELNKDLFLRTMALTEEVIEDAGLEKHQIDEILLVGGSTMIPRVQRLLKDYFDGKEPREVLTDPDEAVAYGAASIGCELSGECFPDEEGPHSLMVIPPSLGVGTAGGLMTELIPASDLYLFDKPEYKSIFVVLKDSVLPIKKSQVFTTQEDNQTRVTIAVYEGQVHKGRSTLAKHCRLLGRFDLNGIPPAPRGTPRIEVTFELDSKGYLNVKAEEKSTGKGEKTTLPVLWELLGNEVLEHMAREQDEARSIIREKRERIDALDNLETDLYDTASQIYNNDKPVDKLDSDRENQKTFTAVKEALETVANALEIEKEEYKRTLSRISLDDKALIDLVEAKYEDVRIHTRLANVISVIFRLGLGLIPN